MKNKFKSVITVLVVTALCLMFASFSPSLDGRAVVVEKGVFPQGLFAKTVGYLPGDVIKVSNATGDADVEILVIGALDPSEGVAIMLSPEAAAALGIEKDSNNIVKITKRSGQDERVYGNAMISSSPFSTKAVDEVPSDAIIEEEESFEDVPERKPVVEDSVPVPEVNDEVLPEVKKAPPAEIDTEDESLLEENQEEFEEEPEYYEPEEISEQTASDYNSEPAATGTESVSEPVEDGVLPESEYMQEYESAVIPEKKVEVEQIAEDDFAEEELEPDTEAESQLENEDSEENPETSSEEYYEDEELPENPAAEESVEEEELPAVEDEKTPVHEESEEKTSAEDEIFTEDFPSDEYEEKPFEEVPESEYEEEYEAIILVPADEMPPAEENLVEESGEAEESALEEEIPDEDAFAEDDESQVYEPIVIAPSEEENQIDEQIAEPEQKESEMPAVAEESFVSSYEKYIAGSIDELERGKYYIQIATLTIDKNIMDIISKYSSNYPVSIVKMSGGIKKQIFIGPLSIDEYAVVLERFKSYGYKDAFVRKIK